MNSAYGIEHPKGGLICLRCMSVISLKEVAEQSSEFNAKKKDVPNADVPNAVGSGLVMVEF